MLRMYSNSLNSIKNFSSVLNSTLRSSSTAKLPYGVPACNWGKNRAARLELAAAYRGLNMLGLNEGVCNHLTVMAPSYHLDMEEEVMLLVSQSEHWAEVSASSLIGLNKNAEVVEGSDKAELTAASIHLGLRRVRPSVRVVMHTHQPYATSIACLKKPELLMIHQNSCRFFNRVAIDTEYTGLADAMDEGERLATVLGDKDVLLMGSHGVIVVADSIAEPFDRLYYLERAATVQVLAQSTGQELSIIPTDTVRRTQDSVLKDEEEYAQNFFYAIYNQLKTKEPQFER